MTGVKIPYVYLAGRMTGVRDRGANWRGAATILLGPDIRPLDPLKLELPSHRPQDIVRTDVAAICRSRAVLAYVGTPSWGTAMELWQALQVGVPVVGWLGDQHDQPLSPWLNYVVTAGMHRTLEAAVDTVRGIVHRKVEMPRG